MSDYTKLDAYKEAFNELKPVKERQIKRRKIIIDNFGIIITLSVIVLSVILFAYNVGYSGTYNLPSSVFSLDIARFIPIGLQVLVALAYLFVYISSVLADRITNHKRFSVIRVLIGFVICSWFFIINHLIYALGFWSLLVMLVIPVIFELVLLLLWKVLDGEFKNTKINKEDFEAEKREIIRNHVFPEYSIKMIIGILSLAIIFSSVLGSVFSKFKREYQVFFSNNQSYAVIVDYSDRVLAQKAKLGKESLTINTNDYKYFSKDNINFTWVIFREVKIVRDDNKTIINKINAKTNNKSKSKRSK